MGEESQGKEETKGERKGRKEGEGGERNIWSCVASFPVAQGW